MARTDRSKAILVSFLLGLIISLAGACLSLWADEIGALQPQLLTPSGIAYNAGAQALSANHVTEAQADFRKSLQLDSRNPGAYLGLAKVEVRKGNAKGALAALRRAVALSPNDPNLQVTLGHYLFWQKDYSEAATVLKRAAELAPAKARPQMELGDLYLVGLHRPQAAIPPYQTALKLDSGNVRLHFMLAKALAATGRVDEAQAQLQEATRLDPRDPSMFQALGDLRLRRHDLSGALQNYAAALKIQPGFIPAHLTRGGIFLAQGNLMQALSEYQGASKSDPKFAPPYLSMGVVYERLNQPSDAERAYRTAISLDPKAAVAFNNLAWLSAEQKSNLGDALLWATKAVQLDPKAATFEDTLGWVYRARGQKREALEATKKAFALAPLEPEILYHLGVIYSELGQGKEAQSAFSQARSLKKTFEESGDAKARLATLNRGR